MKSKNIDFNTAPDSALIRQPAVLSIIPLGRSTMWARVKSGEFPAPIKVSPGITAWRLGDVRRWLDEVAA
ncbi:AlpA family phage regulatory protein [Xanthomonas sp. 3058]|uniref:helix-turn-helix transcriptional regulator n=1 Tax=Xanthomonas sp. 3058 TaxID=3035314 RepID=UPI00162129C9|nr:AlpA family phage regulatory protein [Xanthomonas sp. 3058]MBB5866194.1 putative DNA-binding transcriptional regulator AlpA [Xanthomonas sp. 3058]